MFVLLNKRPTPVHHPALAQAFARRAYRNLTEDHLLRVIEALIKVSSAKAAGEALRLTAGAAVN
jgi:hypothetical protein